MFATVTAIPGVHGAPVVNHVVEGPELDSVYMIIQYLQFKDSVILHA